MYVSRAVLLSVFLGVASIAQAANIAFFDNATYTDPLDESTNLTASLTGLGHTVLPFSGIADTDWAAALTGVDLLVIPELDNGSLFPDLSPAAIAVIANYINTGGGLIMFDRSSGATNDFLNGIFGFALTGSGASSDPALNAANAAGTAFAGGPASLSTPSATEAFATASLPAGALSIYEENGNTSVFLVSVGSGKIVHLAFDWFQLPTPTEWEDVLGRAVTEVSTAAEPGGVPEPATFALMGAGLAAFAVARRKR